MTQIDAPMSAARSKPAPTAAVAPRWRRGRANVNHALPQSEPCPMAALASEAAKVLTLMRALRDTPAQHDAALVEALEQPLDFTRPSEMRDALLDRLKAIESLASHRRATSMKGALFQLYLAANEGRNPGGLLETSLSLRDERRLERNSRMVLRLHYGAISHLESMGVDDDLLEVRRWYFEPVNDVHRVCDRAINDRAGLIAEAKARPCLEPATPGAEA